MHKRTLKELKLLFLSRQGVPPLHPSRSLLPGHEPQQGAEQGPGRAQRSLDGPGRAQPPLDGPRRKEGEPGAPLGRRRGREGDGEGPVASSGAKV